MLAVLKASELAAKEVKAIVDRTAKLLLNPPRVERVIGLTSSAYKLLKGYRIATLVSLRYTVVYYSLYLFFISLTTTIASSDRTLLRLTSSTRGSDLVLYYPPTNTEPLYYLITRDRFNKPELSR